MIDQHQYLLIGGSTKCGTTSVFSYFEFHPAVCPCIMKESRYFLNAAYRLVANRRTNEKYRHFSELFNNCKQGSVRLEATPDYLYSKDAADKIKAELLNCKIIFILRNPVGRLESWYRFASLNGLIAAQTTFEEYIKQQQENSPDAPQHMRALEQSRYAEYLEYYYSNFGKENIHVCFYEHLVADPGKFCREICDFAAIDPHYFDGFDFKIYNKSVAVKSVGAHRLFRKFKRTVRPFTRMFPDALRKRLKLAGYNVEKVYSSANAPETGQRVDITPEMKNYLEQYYFSANKKLTAITGKSLPW